MIKFTQECTLYVLIRLKFAGNFIYMILFNDNKVNVTTDDSYRMYKLRRNQYRYSLQQPQQIGLSFV